MKNKQDSCATRPMHDDISMAAQETKVLEEKLTRELACVDGFEVPSPDIRGSEAYLCETRTFRGCSD